MEILEYADVDAIAVLDLNLTSLNHPLTPKRAAKIREMDPRPFPFFALYAVVDGTVAGQIGVFRLPVVTIEGEQEVGGLWAVCTHPAFRRRGIASALSEEAHSRMRHAGLRISTLGTSRHLAAHALYRKHGYANASIFGSTLARREEVDNPHDLHAIQAEAGEWRNVDALFEQLSHNCLGFARRHPSFIATMVAAGDIGRKDVWLIRRQDDLVGYALARPVDAILSVYSLLVQDDVDPAAAVAAVAHETETAFIRVRVDRQDIATSLEQAGYPPAREGWGTLMIKSLEPGMNADAAGRLLGIGSDRFLVSQVDIT